MAKKAPTASYSGPTAQQIQQDAERQRQELAGLQTQYQTQYQSQLDQVVRGYQDQIGTLSQQYQAQQSAQSGLLSQLNTQLSTAQQQAQQQRGLYDSLLQTQTTQTGQLQALSEAAAANAADEQRQLTQQVGLASSQQSARKRTRQEQVSVRGSAEVGLGLLRNANPGTELLR